MVINTFHREGGVTMPGEIPGQGEIPHVEPPAASASLADQLHEVASDPAIIGTAGLLIGGVSPVAGSAMGLKAAHDEEPQGKPTSLITKLAIGRGIVAIVFGVIFLIAFLIVFFIILSKFNSVSTGFPNNSGATCAGSSHPTFAGITHWTCTNGAWSGTGP